MGPSNSAFRVLRTANTQCVILSVRTVARIRRWLVFDAAGEPSEVRAFFPTNGPAEVLITSRNPDWAVWPGHGTCRVQNVKKCRLAWQAGVMTASTQRLAKRLATYLGDRARQRHGGPVTVCPSSVSAPVPTISRGNPHTSPHRTTRFRRRGVETSRSDELRRAPILRPPDFAHLRVLLTRAYFRELPASASNLCRVGDGVT